MRLSNWQAGVLMISLLAGCGSPSESTGGSGGQGGSGGSGGQGGSGGGGGPACVTDVKPAPGTALTKTGAVVGYEDGGTFAWKGIPFAAPPTGERRWMQPVHHACWSDARPATEFGAVCPQLDDQGDVIGDEDCLTLNVWAPKSATAAAPRPVMVFIHGGGNVQGSASVGFGPVDLYDGAALAEAGDVLLVTFQYRIGPFGWLSRPDLAAPGADVHSGNFGALDQVFALQWIRDNIAAFGGDPQQVMVFGESAGAQDTCLLLASPLAKGLFAAAGMQSGSCAAVTKESAEAFGEQYAAAAGCSGDGVAACLRGKTTSELMLAVPPKVEVAGKQGPYQPYVDGYFLEKEPNQVLAEGPPSLVPILVGANEDETAASVPNMTEAQYIAAVNALLPVFADQVLAEYPPQGDGSAQSFIALTSDAKFICPARRVARAMAGHGVPVYRYHFTHDLDNAPLSKGAVHGLELAFVFNHLNIAGYTPSPAEEELALAMGRYWTRFASTGDPNGGADTAWPKYDVTADPYMQLDDPLQSGEGVHTEKCDFWDSLIP